MNILEVLRARVAALSPGPHLDGLRAVALHIQVAANHLERGQQSGDGTCFTDAVYRTNQGFEGSLKEAYRVISGEDPAGIRPYDIEQYLQKEGRLRPRVLAQFVNYRKEWRNPSTHDHLLDFDEDEALLAIVSVCAFAIVLIDQIAEKLSFEAARSLIGSPASSSSSVTELEQTLELLKKYAQQAEFFATRHQVGTGSAHIVGSLAGFISVNMPSNEVHTNVQLGSQSRHESDLVIKTPREMIVLEIKGLATPLTIPKVIVEQAVAQAATCARALSAEHAIVYFHPAEKDSQITIEERRSADGRIVFVVCPKKKRT